MDQKQIDRLNELAKKAKSPEGLTQWEADERAALRRDYIDAVLGAVKHKITVGTTLSTFSPDEGCTRAQIVTFLYRAHSK